MEYLLNFILNKVILFWKYLWKSYWYLIFTPYINLWALNMHLISIFFKFIWYLIFHFILAVPVGNGQSRYYCPYRWERKSESYKPHSILRDFNPGSWFCEECFPHRRRCCLLSLCSKLQSVPNIQDTYSFTWGTNHFHIPKSWRSYVQWLF